MRKQAIVNARIPGKPYKVACAKCEKTMRESIKPPLFAVDHVVPASEPSSDIHDWNSFFMRLFAPAEKLQILCNPCHDTKTALENSSRKRTRKKAAKRRR